MKIAIILGDNSDIAKAITPMLKADGWGVVGWNRTKELPWQCWDLVIITIGQVSPVGYWDDHWTRDWSECIRSNLITPFSLLKDLWPNRNPDAKVCFFAGSNPNAIMPGYSAYNVSKMALLKLVEQLDVECPEETIFALGPGVTDTKIHKASYCWPNPRLARARKDGSFTPMQRIYDCLKWCLEQPKNIVGGRNICVSDPWETCAFAARLALHPDLLKLRRME